MRWLALLAFLVGCSDSFELRTPTSTERAAVEELAETWAASDLPELPAQCSVDRLLVHVAADMGSWGYCNPGECSEPSQRCRYGCAAATMDHADVEGESWPVAVIHEYYEGTPTMDSLARHEMVHHLAHCWNLHVDETYGKRSRGEHYLNHYDHSSEMWQVLQ